MAVEAQRRARPMRPTRRAAAAGCYAEPPSADPQRFPPRLRPHHPFDRVPAAGAQDPGLRLPRGRPFPHPADPHAGSRQIARSLARALGLDEDLAEALALATISATRRSAMPASARSTAALATFGGFDHNAQTLRVVTALERRYADFDGLNLTWETLEGLVKHNGPLTDRAGAAGRPLSRARPAAAIADYCAAARPRALELSRAPRRRSRRHRRRHRL